MTRAYWTWPIALAAVVAAAAPVAAMPSRDLLTQASFVDRDKAVALQRVQAALAGTLGATDGEAVLMRATALGYRAKLTGSRSDLTASRKVFEALVAAQPRNAEAQLGLGAWHMATINKTGALLGRVFGANRSAGLAALDRAVALGGDHAFYPGLAALFRLKSDPKDPRGRQLAEQATRTSASTALDRILQRSATAILTPVRAGRSKDVDALAQRLLPLGAIVGVN